MTKQALEALKVADWLTAILFAHFIEAHFVRKLRLISFSFLIECLSGARLILSMPLLFFSGNIEATVVSVFLVQKLTRFSIYWLLRFWNLKVLMQLFHKCIVPD